MKNTNITKKQPELIIDDLLIKLSFTHVSEEKVTHFINDNFDFSDLEDLEVYVNDQWGYKKLTYKVDRDYRLNLYTITATTHFSTKHSRDHKKVFIYNPDLKLRTEKDTSTHLDWKIIAHEKFMKEKGYL